MMQPEFIELFKALSDDTRFKLINLLLTRDLCVGALAHQLGVSEAAVSQHLRQLREAGLVKGEKRGYWTHYMVERNRLNQLAEVLKELMNLPPSSESLCSRNPKPKIDSRREGARMCECKCQQPEKLKGRPEECSPEQKAATKYE